MTIKISAVICTYNRAKYLPKAIKSLVEQTLSPDKYEIIVVDNRSTDETKKIVIEEFSHVPNLRYFYEPVQGLASARNTGWKNAKAEYIAYLDDDAVAAPHWLEKIVEVFETVQPQPGGVGGKIAPLWEVERPNWLSDQLLAHLTVMNWSDKPIILNEQQFIAGANMSFPKQLLEKVNGFLVELSLTGKNRLVYNDDLLMLKKIREIGYNCFYHPEVEVQHHIPQSRVNKSYLINRIYWQGVSNAILWLYEESPSWKQRLKLARDSIKKLWRKPHELFLLTQSTDDPQQMWQKCLKYFEIGYILGILGIVN